MLLIKKIVRRITLLFSILVFSAFCVIIASDTALPDTVVANADRVSFMGLFTLRCDDYEQVDFQNNQRVSQSESELMLFGVIPVKEVKVSYDKPSGVYVSGESFGIKLYSDGVMVVGIKDVDSENGLCNPAKESGIEKGDIIVAIDDVVVRDSYEVDKIFNSKNSQPYKIKIKRNGNYKTFTLKPVYSVSDNRYKVGLWVRDSTAGIGTITFFNPKNNSIAALGHPITDVDTNDVIPILNGEAVRADVTRIYKSVNGETGSICCEFTDDVIAQLSVNTMSGIYGRCKGDAASQRYLEVAQIQEIERGPAQLLCTIDGSEPKLYDVKITRISYRDNQVKNMVVKITDEVLLEKTGGIIQGMSGSPIIQNGKLVGALTHVIVDNPTKGYAIFAQTMLNVSNEVK